MGHLWQGEMPTRLRYHDPNDARRPRSPIRHAYLRPQPHEHWLSPPAYAPANRVLYNNVYLALSAVRLGLVVASRWSGAILPYVYRLARLYSMALSNKIHTLIGVALLGLCTACYTGQSNKGHQQSSIPMYIDSAELRLTYLVKHYWERTPLSDSLVINQAQTYEWHLADYLSLLGALSPEQFTEEILLPLETLHGKALTQTLDLYHKYLYEPDSPLGNEDLYRPALQWAISSPQVPQAYQERAKHILELINKNRVGSIASELIYQTLDGKLRRLSRVASPYTILMFGAQGCSSCHIAHEYIKATPIYTQLADQGKLHLLHIVIQLPEEQELSPIDSLRSWIEVGRDYQNQVMDKALYDIKASPSIYLLDKDKRILLKNTNLTALTQYLERL